MGKQCVRIWEIQYVPQQLGQTPYHALRHALLMNHVRAEKKVEFAKVSVVVIRRVISVLVTRLKRPTRMRMKRPTDPNQEKNTTTTET